MPDPQIHAQLRALRKAHGLTQPKMAARLPVGERTYRAWEKGDTSPTVAQLQLIAESFGRTLVELLNFDPNSGTFPAAESPASSDAANRFLVALLGEPDLLPSAKKCVLETWNNIVTRGGLKVSTTRRFQHYAWSHLKRDKYA